MNGEEYWKKFDWAAAPLAKPAEDKGELVAVEQRISSYLEELGVFEEKLNKNGNWVDDKQQVSVAQPELSGLMKRRQDRKLKIKL